MSRSVIWNICTLCSLPPPLQKVKKIDLDYLSICKKKFTKTESSWQIIKNLNQKKNWKGGGGGGGSGGGGGGGGEVCDLGGSRG